MSSLPDIPACFDAMGREKLTIDVAHLIELPMDSLAPACRAFLYAVLELNRDKLKRALHFIRQAANHAADIEEVAYVLYVEAVLLSLDGDDGQAITRQSRCAEISKLTGNRRLESESLLHLSSIYMKLGQPAIAKIYEKEAALIMPRSRRV